AVSATEVSAKGGPRSATRRTTDRLRSKDIFHLPPCGGGRRMSSRRDDVRRVGGNDLANWNPPPADSLRSSATSPTRGEVVGDSALSLLSRWSASIPCLFTSLDPTGERERSARRCDA